MSQDIRELKKAVRRQANAGRDSLTEEQKASYSARICEKLLALPAGRTAQTIAVYQWMKNEVRLDVAIDAWRARGARVCFPCSVGRRVMYFYDIKAGEMPDFMVHPGKLFPDADPAKAIPASEFDMVVIPGVAFDNQRNRCGYVGGFYATLMGQLLDTDCFLTAVAYDEQFVDAVPTGHFDRKMPMIVTPTRILCE